MKKKTTKTDAKTDADARKECTTELHKMIDNLFGEEKELTPKEQKELTDKRVKELREEFESALDCEKTFVIVVGSNKIKDGDWKNCVGVEYGSNTSQAEVITILEKAKFTHLRRC